MSGFNRPTEPVDLPDRCEVEVEVRAINSAKTPPSLDEVYATLNLRFDSGEQDIAQRHNDHQP